MNEGALIVTFLTGYFVFGHFVSKYISKQIVTLNKYIRFITRSFLYALFFGVGIAGSGGEPGFGFPAPNLMAIILMLSKGLYQRVIAGLVILLFWWLLIFIFMCMKDIIHRGKYAQQLKQL